MIVFQMQVCVYCYSIDPFSYIPDLPKDYIQPGGLSRNFTAFLFCLL